MVAWSAAWTAPATSCAVSASMTMFRRSRTRRTTRPACGGASRGPMASGSTPGLAGCLVFRGTGAAAPRSQLTAYEDDTVSGPEA